MLNVVVFTGGRGSGVLSRRLLGHRDVRLTLAINGYDDGASTGEVRRYLGDSLGPSDYRKNASRVAEAMSSCSPGLVRVLDARLSKTIDADSAVRDLAQLIAGHSTPGSGLTTEDLRPDEQAGLALRLDAFVSDWRSAGRPFRFGDCAVGNLVFAGCFLRQHRRFNAAVDDYAALVGLAPGIIENVTNGENAYLVALDVDGKILGTEESIVDSTRANRIAELFLIDRPLDASEGQRLVGDGAGAARQFFNEHTAPIRLNERLAQRIDDADVIVYAPGTQHSSLFPSYLTPGLGDRIANNVRAVKLLITNLQYDAEIAGASAVSLVERALFYLTDKGSAPRAAPSLITHYLFNDPRQADSERPYVPLGQVASLEDPRLVRIGYFEERVTGRHDAAKVLEPFLESWLEPRRPPRIGVLLYGTASANKLTQTLLELARGRREADTDLTVFVSRPAAMDAQLLARLPFAVEACADDDQAAGELKRRAASGAFDYVGLFESSGMYRGDDLNGLFRFLEPQRLDAVWGSRRLSVRDIDESYRHHYYRQPIMRAISRTGSHVLSLACLMFYGRYVADTLSGVRVVRAGDAAGLPVPLTHPRVNEFLLTRLLKRRADLLEVPVQFISLSPERVRRTGVLDGLRGLATIVGQRFVPRRDGGALPGQ